MTEEEQTTGLKDIIERAKKNLVNFRYYLLTNGKDEVAPAKYHYTWSDMLLHGEDNFAVEGFREAAKGQIVLRAFPLYCLMFPSEERDYIVLIKQNKDLAIKKLLEIEEEYLTNPVLSANLVNIKQKSASIFSVDVKDAEGKVINIRIEAYGKGSSIRGLANKDRRPRIVVLDDPQDTDDARSDMILDDDWDWFLSDIKFLGQVTRIFLISNNLGDRCISERVFGSSEELGFKTMRTSILDEEDNPTWPEKFPKEEIDKEKESYRRLGKIDIWMRERMCISASEESRIFHKDDFIRYSPLYIKQILQGCNLYVTVDPASSKNPGACYRAIVVNAVTEDNRWIVADISYGRWASDEFIEKLFDVVIKWTPFLGKVRRLPVGIEKGHYKQVIEPFIYREMQRRNVFFDILPIEHAKVGSKLERVKMLSPRFKARTIMLPECASWLAEFEAELMGVTKDGFKSLFNDLIDAFSMQTQIAKPPMRSNMRRQEPQRAEEYKPLQGLSGMLRKQPDYSDSYR